MRDGLGRMKERQPEGFGGGGANAKMGSDNRERLRRRGAGVASGIAIGAGFGVALGVAFGNLALGLAIGATFGVAIGAALEQRATHPEPADRRVRVAILLGLAVLMLLGGVLLALILLQRGS
jgi:hypothetical protein